MTKLLTENTKMKKSQSDSIRIYNFGIPAYMSASGVTTCPNARECVKPCYARQGNYVRFPNVANALENRLDLYLKDDASFALQLISEIKSKRKITHIRVHDSGDFFSSDYLDLWLYVARKFPKVKFYAYTKMVGMIKEAKLEGKIPSNFTFIFSYGGSEDHLINPKTDRHSKVFINESDSKYIDASNNDLLAIGRVKRIGLVYHGSNNKAKTLGVAS